MCIRDRDKVVGTNRDKITLLEDKYEAKTFTGTFDGNDKTISTLKDGQIQVEGMNNKTPSESVTAKFTYDFDLKYIGEEVSVLYKDSTNSGTPVSYTHLYLSSAQLHRPLARILLR